MPCKIWHILLEHCYEAESAYSQAITNSSGLVGVELDKALQQAEQAREVSQVCEKALQHHDQMHDCIRRAAFAKASDPPSVNTKAVEVRLPQPAWKIK